MIATKWIRTGNPFEEWTGYDSADIPIGYVDRINEGLWNGKRPTGESKTFSSKEAAQQWIDDPEHPLIEQY